MNEIDQTCALILGGYLNGYSIVQELYACGIKNLVLFDSFKSPASMSNKINSFSLIDLTPQSLLKEISKLRKSYTYIIIYPTSDIHLTNLLCIYDEIISFCYIPFNSKNILKSLNKFYQYNSCERLSIPFPKTIQISQASDLSALHELQFPIILKPNTRKDITTNVFRNKLVNTKNEITELRFELNSYFSSGIQLIASEYVPGPCSNIFAYIGYRNQKGEILNEWLGKKITQHPNQFGVFSTASNEAPNIIQEQGRKLLNGMDLMGFCEPEFKYDPRDQTYKLMEINLRPMMWNRIGHLSGVNIHYTQFQDAIGAEITKFVQDKDTTVYLSHLKSEIINLLRRKNYWKNFKQNLLTNKNTSFAFFDKNDILPFLTDKLQLFKQGGNFCLKKLKMF